MFTMTTNDESAKAAPRGNPGRPERTCAGCGKHAAADDLVRVVHDPSAGAIAVDLAASGFGRGAHVHPTPDCLAKAVKAGAEPFDPMGTGRFMKDMVLLPKSVMKKKPELKKWLQLALDFTATLPPKKKKAMKKKASRAR